MESALDSYTPNIINSNTSASTVTKKIYITITIQNLFKVTVQFERCFRLMGHICVISCRNPINLYINEKLIKFSKSLFNFYLVISNM